MIIQRDTLELLYEHPEGVFQKDLNINAIRKLEKLGYVKKGVETFSSGKKMIFITEEGKKALITPIKCEIKNPKYQYCNKKICVNNQKCYEIFSRTKMEFENKQLTTGNDFTSRITMRIKPESPLFEFFNK